MIVINRKSGRRWRSMAAALAAGAVVLAPLGAAIGDTQPLRDPVSEPGQTLDRTVLSKAAPDECYDGVFGDAPVALNGDGTCRAGMTPKVNQAYVWGLAKAGTDLWFGTAPNVQCLVEQGYLGNNKPSQTNSYVCDPTTKSPYNPNQIIGNFRPPKIYRYDLSDGTRHDMGATVPGSAATPGTPAFLLQTTLGIRSAGTANGVVLMGGPSVVQGGINLFAFDADTDAFLGARNVQTYSNIRKWVNVDGQLYTGVANNPAAGENPGGAVLRWTGDKADPLGTDAFQVVGHLDGEGAELTGYQGRLFVATWPCCEQSGGMTGGSVTPAGLWMSPLIGDDHTLTSLDADGWQKVWTVTDYEPDPVIASVYGGGALASYGGYLYWGTMHVPGTGLAAHQKLFPNDPTSSLDQFVDTNRAISIFRGKDFGTGTQQTQVLYGDKTEPVYDPSTQTWNNVATRMGAPLYGPAGFGNRFNNYTWTMDVFQGRLYVGTMDWSYLITDGIDSAPAGSLPNGMTADQAKALLKQQYPNMQPGADLWRFDSANGPAKAESTAGVGNYLNYGIRTMLADNDAQDPALYLGTANPMNLMTDTTDNKPEGGWELLKLTPRSGGGGTPGGGGPGPVTHAKVIRVAGPDRIGTSVEASKNAYPQAGSAKGAVLAASNGYADALSGGPLAARKGGPLLLTKPGQLDPRVLAELQRVLPAGSTVYVLGGTSALSADVAAAVTKAGFTVVRLAGDDRYATAVRVADAVGQVGAAFLASGQGFADALAAGPAAASQHGVVLQTDGTTMPKATATWLAAHPGATVYSVGSAATAADPSAAESFAGANRYDTATRVAQRFFANPGQVAIASGEAFADALAGGAVAATVGAPVVLTRQAKLPSQSTDYLAAKRGTLELATVYGGTVAVSDSVVAAVVATLQ